MNTTIRFRINEIKWAPILGPRARNKYNIYSINRYPMLKLSQYSNYLWPIFFEKPLEKFADQNIPKIPS